MEKKSKDQMSNHDETILYQRSGILGGNRWNDRNMMAKSK